jgi:hypothetical protein
MLILIVALKVSLHLSGSDSNPFDSETIFDGESPKFKFFVSLAII